MGKIESRTITSDDMLVTEFWEKSYLPYWETGWKGTGMRASTPQPCAASSRFGDNISKAHFGTTTL